MKPINVLLVTVASVAALIGVSCKTLDAPGTCDGHDDCADGLFCVDGACMDHAPCEDDGDCTDGTCGDDGRCIPHTTKGCKSHDDCAGDTPWCSGATGKCHVCLDAEHCGDGEVCVAGSCVDEARCEDDGDCEDGTCGDDGRCIPHTTEGCKSHDDCAGDTPWCSGATGKCHACFDAEHCGDGEVCVAGSCVIEIICSTLVGDISTDNSAAMETCLTTAASAPGGIVRIPVAAGAYRFAADIITVPEGVSVIGEEGVTLNGTFRLNSHSKLINLTFSNRSRTVIIGDKAFVTGAEVRDCTFGASSWAALMAYRANDCLIDNNAFNNAAGLYEDGKKPGQNIIILGGKRNKITNNRVFGGKTGIIFKYSRNANGGGFESMPEDNIIVGNRVEGFLEEGISFDVVGNSSAQAAALDYDRVAGAGGNRVTLTHEEWATAGSTHVGYDMIFLSGALAGQTRRIMAQAGAELTLLEGISGVVAGDDVVIGATFKRNIVAYNTVVSSHAGSILLFGMGFHNRIEGNTVTAGSISVRSLDNLIVSDIGVTGTNGRAPCGHNLIRDNTVGNNIILFYRVIDNIDGTPWPNAYMNSPYYSYGNTVVNNTIGNVLWASYQDGCAQGNSGGTETPFGHVTLNNCTSLNPPALTCSNLGFSCCPSCHSGAITALDGTCAEGVCCVACNVDNLP